MLKTSFSVPIMKLFTFNVKKKHKIKKTTATDDVVRYCTIKPKAGSLLLFLVSIFYKRLYKLHNPISIHNLDWSESKEKLN